MKAGDCQLDAHRGPGRLSCEFSDVNFQVFNERGSVQEIGAYALGVAEGEMLRSDKTALCGPLFSAGIT